MSEYGIATSGNLVRHRCETNAYRDLRVVDKIMPLDSKDPSLILHVKGFDGFHVTSHWQARSMFRMHIAVLTEPKFDEHEL